MRRKVVPIENHLLLYLAKHGGSATLTRIRLDFGGRLTCAQLEQARQKLGDLVVLEKTGTKPTDRYKRRGRPTTSLSLSLRGWAAVQFLQPGWQPRRLAVPILKAWLAELQAERDPWALQITRDSADAWSWRNHEKDRKEREREKERKREREELEPRRPSAGRNRSEEELEARAEWARSKGFRSSYDESDKGPRPDEFTRHNATAGYSQNRWQAKPITPSSYVPPATPAQPRPESFAAELARIQGSQLAGFATQHSGFDNSPQSEPRAATGESRSEVVARARASGHFFDGAFHSTDNQIVSWQEWAAWAPKQKGAS